MRDVDQLPRVGGTAAGNYRRLGPDVLVAIPVVDYVQSEEGARRSLDEVNRIAKEAGRRQALVVLVDSVQSQDAGSRKVWQRELDPGLVTSLALVSSSLLGRAIASFFTGLRRPVVPTRLFASLEEAAAWSRAQVESHGGPVCD